jgi:hypothetical protein
MGPKPNDLGTGGAIAAYRPLRAIAGGILLSPVAHKRTAALPKLPALAFDGLALRAEAGSFGYGQALQQAGGQKGVGARGLGEQRLIVGSDV